MATILIVDDHVLNRKFLLTLLGYGGHHLLEAADGVEGLKLAVSERPELVITDILMPNMDGYEFVTRMRTDPVLAGTPIIFYTATYREREANVMARACGVRWVLQKPSEPETILQIVHEALGLPALSAPSPVLTAPPPEGSRFSTIDNQLAEYLVELESSSQLMSQIIQSEHGGLRREHLNRIAERLTNSLSSLQAVSLRLSALVELGIELAGERNPEHLIQVGGRVAQNICVAKYAVLGVLDNDCEHLSHFVIYGLEDEVRTGINTLSPRDGVLGKLLEKREPCRISGLDGNPRNIGLPASHPPVHSFLGVPIVSRDRIYGWLYLVDKLGANEFSDIDERAAATVATQLAVAYENLALYEEIQRHHLQLSKEVADRMQVQEALRKTLRARTVMAECKHVLVHAANETTLLLKMCRTIVDVGGYRMAWIGYLNEAGTLTLMAQAGNTKNEIDEFLTNKLNDELDWSPALKAIREVQPSVVTDVNAEPKLRKWWDYTTKHGYRSALSLPLCDDSGAFGVLTIYESEPDLFEGEQISMFKELADDIAYGIVNLRIKTARKKIEQTLLATEEKLSAILGSIDNVVWSATDKELLYLNQVAEKVYGRPVSDFFLDKNLWFNTIHPDDLPRVEGSMSKLLAEGMAIRQYRILRPDGQVRWVEDRTKAVLDNEGKLVRFDGVISDISERRQYEARIEYLATHDALTNLANRNLLEDRVRQAIVRVQRSEQLVALLFLDLDRFKEVNDSLGHEIGDTLLKAVATRLLEAIREGDTVARQGGDEFIILLIDLQSQDDIAAIANKLLNAFSVPFLIGNHELHIGVSIGITVCPNDGTDISVLMRNADTAMYRAKAESGNCVQFYSHEMRTRAIERVDLENALHKAIEHKQFQLLYQPQVDIGSGKVVGAEALIRWHHPKLGTLRPDEFIPLAEDTGLIIPIGEWVIRTACEQNRAWQKKGLPPLRISVNLSARQCKQEDLVETVARLLKNTGLSAHYLELELTEGIVMNNAAQFITKLRKLKKLGVKLSIDDFGTGYSSLNYLKRFPLDRLKIDQSFVRNLTSNADDSAIVLSVIGLGHSLNLKVVAEGVETKEQLAFLTANRCDEMQGFYFNEPLSAEEFAALLVKAGIITSPETDAARLAPFLK